MVNYTPVAGGSQEEICENWLLVRGNVSESGDYEAGFVKEG